MAKVLKGLRRWGRSERDAAIMAITSYALVMHRRGSGEPWSVILSESLVATVWLIATVMFTSAQPLVSQSSPSWVHHLTRLLRFAGLAIPTLSRLVVKAAGGNGSAWEMVMLSTIGLAACALALVSRGRETYR